MVHRTPIYAYAAAFVLGLLVYRVVEPRLQPPEASLLVQALSSGALYALFGILTGFVWPFRAWKWGLWLAAPILVTVGPAMAFSGYPNVGAFIRGDFLALTSPALGGALGAMLGAWLRARRQTRPILPADSQQRP